MLHLFLPLWPRVLERYCKIKWGKSWAELSGCNVGRHQKISTEGECQTLEEIHAGVLHSSALTLQRVGHPCTFFPLPIRPVRMFLWDSTSATPQVLGDEKRWERDRSQQWKAFRAIPGCRTFGRDLCMPCRLEKSSHLFKDKIQRCCHVSVFLNYI